MFRLLYYLYFQSICDSGQQGCEPGGPNQTGSRAAQILHERDGMISISQTEGEEATGEIEGKIKL